MPVCHTRFRIPWQWDGSPAFLQSRSQDETGYVQPTTAARGGRGLDGGKWGSVYHLNGIQSWGVASDGVCPMSITMADTVASALPRACVLAAGLGLAAGALAEGSYEDPTGSARRPPPRRSRRGTSTRCPTAGVSRRARAPTSRQGVYTMQCLACHARISAGLRAPAAPR